MKRLLKICAIFILLPVIRLMDRFIMMRYGADVLTVLYYHRVSDRCRDGMTVSPEAFENQLKIIKKRYHVIAPDTVAELAGSALPVKAKRSVLITFDDGYEDNYTTALPLLEKYKIPAIFFISTGLVGNHVQFLHDRQLHPGMMFNKMSWDQVKDARARGITIGLHTYAHANLGKLSHEEAVEEIERSIRDCKRHFGDERLHMSYPFGKKKDITSSVQAYVESHPDIKTLFSAYGGKNYGPLSLYNIKRINMGYQDQGVFFLFKCEGELKGVIDAVRWVLSGRKPW